MANIRVNRQFDFVDREPLLAELKDVIRRRADLDPPHQAPRESEPMCLLAGTPGIGKTRALAVLEELLGIPVLFATFGNGTPFDPQVDAQDIECATAHRLLHSVAEPVSVKYGDLSDIRTLFPGLTLARLMTMWVENNPEKAKKKLVIFAIDEAQKLPPNQVCCCLVLVYM